MFLRRQCCPAASASRLADLKCRCYGLVLHGRLLMPQYLDACRIHVENKEWLDVQGPTDGWVERIRAMS